MPDDRVPDEGGPGENGIPAGPDLAREALARAREGARGRAPARPRRAREQRSSSRSDDRDPKLFGAAIREFVTDRGWQTTASVASVLTNWEQVVGAEVAAHCRPDRIEDGTLHLVAESTAWATQLRLLSRSILQRVRDELGPDLVTRIRVTGPTAPSWQRGPRRVTGGRGPRDTYG